MGSGASSEARAARARQVMREAGQELPESVPDAQIDGAAQQVAAQLAISVLYNVRTDLPRTVKSFTFMYGCKADGLVCCGVIRFGGDNLPVGGFECAGRVRCAAARSIACSAVERAAGGRRISRLERRVGVG